jgi:hypothetical protein
LFSKWLTVLVNTKGSPAHQGALSGHLAGGAAKFKNRAEHTTLDQTKHRRPDHFATRGRVSANLEQALSRVVFEELGIADVAPQDVYAFVPAHVGHLE